MKGTEGEGEGGGGGVSTHLIHGVGQDLWQLELVAVVPVLVDVLDGEARGVGLLRVPAAGDGLQGGRRPAQRHRRRAQQQH